MPSTYKRKTDRQSWSEEAMSMALEALRNGTCGYLKAAKQFNVPKSTLERRFKNKNKQALDHSKQLGSRKLTFPMELEKHLVDYVKNIWKLCCMD
jgi:FKBP-type peptidyl-prolyl cis-trans isomerase (trigger factor)